MVDKPLKYHLCISVNRYRSLLANSQKLHTHLIMNKEHLLAVMIYVYCNKSPPSYPDWEGKQLWSKVDTPHFYQKAEMLQLFYMASKRATWHTKEFKHCTLIYDRCSNISIFHYTPKSKILLVSSFFMS